MKKPYLRRYGHLSHFNIYIVDGRYIRSHFDEDFTNFGQPFRFPFIPKNEFWIDKESSGDEAKYYIDHLLTEHHLMAKGKSYPYALKKADARERSERRKSQLVAHYHHKSACPIHKKLLKKYSGKIKVWIVKGELVRDLFFIDFTEGGHDLVYHFIPKNEVWIDDDISPKERKFILLHELHERNLMAERLLSSKKRKKSLDLARLYELAHHSSSELEFFCRHHSRLTDQKIRKEIKKARTFDCSN